MNISAISTYSNNICSFGRKGKNKVNQGQKRKEFTKAGKASQNQKNAEQVQKIASEQVFINELDKNVKSANTSYTVFRTIAEDSKTNVACAYSGARAEKPIYVPIKPFDMGGTKDADNLLLANRRHAALRGDKDLSTFVSELKDGIVKKGDETIRVQKTNLLDNINKQLEDFNQIAEKIKKWIPTVSKTVYRELNDKTHKEEFLEANPYLKAADVANSKKKVELIA